MLDVTPGVLVPVLVPLLIAMTALGAYAVRRVVVGRPAPACMALAARARRVAVTTESLAALVSTLPTGAVAPSVRYRVRDALAWLGDATAELRRGTQPALRKAVTDFDNGVVLLDAAITRVE